MWFRILCGAAGVCAVGLAQVGCESSSDRPIERQMVIERVPASSGVSATAPYAVGATPTTVVHEYDVVTAPPPPPIVEVVPVRPYPAAVWVPGYWVPRPRVWVWVRGHWR